MRAVLFSLTLATLAVCSSSPRAQESIPDPFARRSGFEHAIYYRVREPAPEFLRASYEADERRTLYWLDNGLEFERIRSVHYPLDAVRVRNEEVRFQQDDDSWIALWRSRERQDFEGGAKVSSFGLAIGWPINPP